MKIALYIEDGLEQIVLTPQTETEKGILGKLSDGTRQLSIKKGSFYQTNGGWTRYAASYQGGYGSSDDNSTMIILRPVDKTRPENPDDGFQPEPSP